MDPLSVPFDGPAGAPEAESSSLAEPARVRRLVHSHFDDLWRFARRLGVLEVDIDDVLQDVIVITSKRLGEIAPSRERSFLFGTTFRVASERRRRREGRREVGTEALTESEHPGLAPDALLDEARARVLLDRVLAAMPTELRAVFTLYEVEEMTMSEIADVLSLPPGTVASRLRRARALFEDEVTRLQRGGTSR